MLTSGGGRHAQCRRDERNVLRSCLPSSLKTGQCRHNMFTRSFDVIFGHGKPFWFWSHAICFAPSPTREATHIEATRRILIYLQVQQRHLRVMDH